MRGLDIRHVRGFGMVHCPGLVYIGWALRKEQNVTICYNYPRALNVDELESDLGMK